ncbi:hypothetical protein C1E24_14350 [Pseudoalteromonas phenolica]|uniref:Membrane-anchored protein n=1 Tax=Pseudoalteromonas phenolica TaxID=161398 RepID=A0A5R9Q1B7_9GAMM|nr:hypothetical protein [Pseudoalteromonas phenolica]TLX46346.1 hypothetical protein C1E24_14350 [Pseudoalteromonas phenolica]
MNKQICDTLVKVPQITMGFWVIKILATTLSETGGDAVSMSMNLGYLVGTVIFMSFFIVAVFMQIKSTKFNPAIYWIAIIASTTVGTTLADFADRSLGIGYFGGSTLLAVLLITTLVIWYKSLGSISVSSVSTPKAESFYWLTIMFSQTLGTALGDWTTDSTGLGYVGSAYIFSAGLVAVLALYLFTKLSRTLLFWLAFVITRPLGAVVGDYLDKPIAQGGLELSRYSATTTLLFVIIILVVLLPQRPALKQH